MKEETKKDPRRIEDADVVHERVATDGKSLDRLVKLVRLVLRPHKAFP